jgi:LPXTG-motif cell wall-anchored protein
MRRWAALGALVALVAALAIPAGAAEKTRSRFALKGEARGLELAVLGEGVTLGLALSQVDSLPKAIGVGAGQCSLLGSEADPNDLPCSGESTVKTEYPGDGGDGGEICINSLPAPLSDIVDLKAACGSSKSFFRNGVAQTTNKGQVLGLNLKLPVGLRLLPVDLSTEQVQQVVDTVTDVLAPVLGLAPQEVQDVLQGAEDTVFETLDGLLEVIQGTDVTDALKIELGTSVSNVTRKGDVIESSSDAAGAKIGVLGIPSVGLDGKILQPADPLENGLLIIEVGTARASASVNRATADSGAAASAALVTVKVRDITSPTPKYVEISVAPGETVTVLEGTPLESTIVAADSTTSQSPGKASAVADAVKLHLLKGVNDGVRLGLASASALASAEVEDIPDAPVVKNRAPKVLPLTGARNMSALAIVLLLAAGAAFMVRRRFNS